MSSIQEFSKEELVHLRKKLQNYLQKEHDIEIGTFESEDILNFFSKELGFYFYTVKPEV